MKPSLFRLRHGFRMLLLAKGTATIGRRPTCDYALRDRKVSREHARIVIGESSAAVEDLSSANGVYVNGRRISGMQRLQPGDLITLGNESLEVVGFGREPTLGSEQSEVTYVGRQAIEQASRPPTPMEEDWDDDAPTVYGEPSKSR